MVQGIVCKHYFLGQFDLWAGCQLGRSNLIRWLRSCCCLDHHAFYCLLSSARWKKFKGRIVRFLPTKIRKSAEQVLSRCQHSTLNYVRGQITSSYCRRHYVHLIFFKIIGLRYAVTLRDLCGDLEFDPLLG